MTESLARPRANTTRAHRVSSRLRKAIASGAAAAIVLTGVLAATPAAAADRNVTNFSIDNARLVGNVYVLACQQQQTYGDPADVIARFTSLSYLRDTHFTIKNLTLNKQKTSWIGTEEAGHSVTLHTWDLAPAMTDRTTVHNLILTHPRGIEKSFKIKREQGISARIQDHPQNPGEFWQGVITNNTSVDLRIRYATRKADINKPSPGTTLTLRPGESYTAGGFRKDNRSYEGFYVTSGTTHAGNECDTANVDFPRTTTSTTAVGATSYFYGQNVALSGTVTPSAASGTYEFPIVQTGAPTAAATPTGNVHNGAASATVRTPNVGSYTVAGGYRTGSIYNASTSNMVSFTVLADSVSLGTDTATITPQSRNVAVTLTPANSTTPVNEGTVSLYQGTSLLGSGPVTAGSASVPLTQLPSGTSGTLTAQYTSAGNYQPASGSIPFTLSGFENGSFSMTSAWADGSSDTIEYGNTVAFDLQVRDSAGNAARGDYRVNGLTSALTCTLDANGACVVSATPTPGTYTVTASATNPASEVVFTPPTHTLKVLKAPVTMTVAPLFGYADGTQSITVAPDNALTTIASGSVTMTYPTPSGTATFTLPLTNGIATLNRADLPRNTALVTFTYAGSELYGATTLAVQSTEITHALSIALDRAGTDPQYYLGETATATATLTTNATDLENYTVQFLRDGIPVGAPQAIDPATNTASIEDDFAAQLSVPGTATLSALLVRKGVGLDVGSEAVSFGVLPAQTTLNAEVTVSGSDATFVIDLSSPYDSPDFGGEALITITDGTTTASATVLLSAGGTGSRFIGMFATPGANGSAPHTFADLADGTYYPIVEFTPASTRYDSASVEVPPFEISNTNNGGGGDNGGGNNGGGGNGDGNGDGNGGNGNGGNGTGTGTGNGTGTGDALPVTGAEATVPLALGVSAMALGLMLWALARRRARKA